MKKNYQNKQAILLMLMALMLPLCIWAKSSTLIVELKDGNKASFNLSDQPKLSIPGNQLIIESSTLKTSYSYERKDVVNFYFSEDTGIENESMDENTVKFTQVEANRIVISNLSDGDQITVSNLSGRLYNNCLTRNSNEAVIDLSTSSKGVYIIKVGKKQTIKMIRK